MPMLLDQRLEVPFEYLVRERSWADPADRAQADADGKGGEK